MTAIHISEGLPGVLGNKGIWPISTREQGYKGKGTKNVLGNTGTKHSLREDKKLEKKKKDVTGTYLATFSLHPCFMELRQRLN